MNLHCVLEESLFLWASLVLFTSSECGVACQAHGTLRCRKMRVEEDQYSPKAMEALKDFVQSHLWPTSSHMGASCS